MEHDAFSTPGTTDSLPSTTTVLLIDSDNEGRQYWGEQLKICSRRYRILDAEDGETGLAICKSEPVDCVVLELHLPLMSGFKVLLRLNPIVHRSLQTPVVVLSDLTLPPVVQAGKKLGAQDFLNKTKASGDALDKAIQKSIATVCKSR
jgi:CheY-like chemotaxis protein